MNPNIYRAIAIAKGCKLYARTGIKPNRAWTPTAMLKAVADITGTTYKRGDLLLAHDDLMAILEITKGMYHATEAGHPIPDMTDEQIVGSWADSMGETITTEQVAAARRLLK